MSLNLFLQIIKNEITYISFLFLICFNNDIFLIVSGDIVLIVTMIIIHPKRRYIMKAVRWFTFIKNTVDLI